MSQYDIRCPTYGTINFELNLEETEGWIECENCLQVVEVLSTPGLYKKFVPLYTSAQLATQCQAACR